MAIHDCQHQWGPVRKSRIDQPPIDLLIWLIPNLENKHYLYEGQDGPKVPQMLK